MIHSETYRIRNYEADTNGNLWLTSLANYLQDAANRHAIELGAGVPQLLEQGLTWVLHRMRLDIHRWPRLPEEVTVTTHPSGEERVFVYRDYRMYDSEQTLLVTASSTWLLFDLVKRKLTSPSPELKQYFEPYHNFPHFPRANQKYPPLPESWQYQTQVTARHNEIDQNQHVNNSVYFQWLLEPLPADFISTHQCQSLDITFKAECMRGETVHSLCQPLSDHQLMHRLQSQEGTEIVTALTTWSS
ncbi:acyl-[acyl-carrier-protein] thioesterase [Telluribacter sp.]|jgi:acyl-ACP thioesterase|uniref:acyl-[acyl-carrier-protein] thioesterase n=1 Tax=Telluribacter sp. TaxID=1978767 RepID=UPI002E0D2D4F|nr:acyl-ACP thioesterase domain-containing protein [Telluribacter sp.]